MIYQALTITIIGMIGVFVFLILLICGMNILRVVLANTSRRDLAKIAAAVAIAKHQE